jgi:hypothetical protein
MDTREGHFGRNEVEKESTTGSGTTIELLFHWITLGY